MSQHTAPPSLNPSEIAQGIRNSTSLALGKSTIQLTPENREKVIQCFSAIQLFSHRDGAVWGNDGESIKLEVGGLHLTVDNIEDCYIVNELFGHGFYAITTPNDVHVIDIGANLLFASLYFAKMEKVIKVTSFEPLKPTLEKAYHHLAMNPDLAPKIDIHPYGLSGAERTISVAYSRNIKGSTRTDMEWKDLAHLQNRPDYEMQEAPLKRASTVLREVIAGSPCNSFILKVDCEGAETAILRDLHEQGILEKFSMILMEWHGNNQEALEKLLLASQFQSISIRPHGKSELGMIYAFNTARL